SDALHGHGGEWRVERQRLRWDLLDAFRRAAEQTGIPPTDDFNRGDNLGCGYFEVNQRRGVRWNAAKAFLRPAIKRPNLKIVTGAQVRSLLIANQGSSRVTGVECAPTGELPESKRYLASCEVVLAAGAIGSAQLLQLSGIGAPDALRAAGIQPRLALAGVGKNLQDHLQLRLIYRVSNARTLNRQANSLVGKVQMGMQY